MENAQLIYLQTIEALLEDNEMDKAIDALLELDKQTQAGLKSDIILQSGNFKQASTVFRNGIISYEEFARASARTRFGLLELMKTIPERLERDAKIRNLGTYQFRVPDEARLEKVLGGHNNLLKINWLEKALRSAKAVCRVVCEDGNLGTGFLTKEGYIFTNNHVLGNAEIAKTARIEFNYEMDSSGNIKTRSSYQLDTTDFITSEPTGFDFARVRVLDNPASPLSQWGFLEFDLSALPTVGESVTIIQHPKGEDKQIALNANEVVGLWDKYLFYTTDTEPGSSGSPVFNKDWKVVAIHHAGKTDAEGGIQINAKGDKKGANRGILFAKIFDFIATSGQNPKDKPVLISSKPAIPEAPKEGKESVSIPQPIPHPSPAIPQPIPSGIPKFVILYDIADESCCRSLNKHLSVLKFTKKIRVYNIHYDLKPGEDALSRAKEEIAGAHKVICLITKNLFNSEEIYNLALEAMNIIPLWIENMDLEGTGLEKLKSLPSRSRWVSDFENEDSAYFDIVENLKVLI